MMEDEKLPKELVVGEVYTANVVRQYLQKHRYSYVGKSIFGNNPSDEIKIVNVLKGNFHTYEDGYNHLSMNYKEVYELAQV